MLGTNKLVQLINLLSVELDILEEQVHTIEAIYGSSIIQHIRPVSDNDVLVMVLVQSLIVTHQKDDETELHDHHKE